MDVNQINKDNFSHYYYIILITYCDPLRVAHQKKGNRRFYRENSSLQI